MDGEKRPRSAIRGKNRQNFESRKNAIADYRFFAVSKHALTLSSQYLPQAAIIAEALGVATQANCLSAALLSFEFHTILTKDI